MAKATLDDILKEQKKQTKLLEKIEKSTSKKTVAPLISPIPILGAPTQIGISGLRKAFSPMQVFSSEDEEGTIKQIEALVRKLKENRVVIVDNDIPDTVENIPVLTFDNGDLAFPMLDGIKLRAVRKYNLEGESKGLGNNTFVLKLEMEVQCPGKEEKTWC